MSTLLKVYLALGQLREAYRPMQKNFAFILLLLVVTVKAGTEFDEFESDFDVSFDEAVVQIGAEKSTSVFGSVNFEAHYNYKTNNATKNLSSAKILVDLIADHKLKNGNKVKSNIKGYYDLIYSSDLGNYTGTPQGYESEININELFVEGKISKNADFKLGRQIVVWGKADTVRVTDILNPLDLRVPGMVDVRNLRIGRTMSKLDYYLDNINLSIIGIHENNFSKSPKQYSDFRPILANTPSKEPNNSLANTGIALALEGAFEGYDAAIYFADTYVDKPYLKEGVLHYDNKSKMYGAAFSGAIENYLVTAEVAYFDTIKYVGVNNTKSRIDSMIGFEYSGIDDGSISYEFATRSIKDYEAAIYSANNGYKHKNDIQQALRINKSYKNQTIILNAMVSMFGDKGREGGTANASLDYIVNDRLSLSVGVIDYIGGSSPVLDSLKENDRVFTKATYAF